MDGVDPTFNEELAERGYNVPYEQYYQKITKPLWETVEKNVPRAELEAVIKDNNWAKRFPIDSYNLKQKMSVKISEMKDYLKEPPKDEE
jgi:hypothetical protein